MNCFSERGKKNESFQYHLGGVSYCCHFFIVEKKTVNFIQKISLHNFFEKKSRFSRFLFSKNKEIENSVKSFIIFFHCFITDDDLLHHWTAAGGCAREGARAEQGLEAEKALPEG